MKHLLFLVLIMLSSCCFSREDERGQVALRNISGRIVDKHGVEIPAAMISVEETNQTFFADANGNFQFHIEADKIYTIKINSVGYLPLRLTTSGLGNFSEVGLLEL